MTRRGDIAIAALPGDFGKPRPVLIIQSDLFDHHPSVTVLPITSHLVEAPLVRFALPADDGTGLQKPSQVMIDKCMTLRRDRLEGPVGRISESQLLEITRLLAVFLGVAA